MKKTISIILCLIMVLSVFASVPFSASAEDTDIAVTGTEKTQEEALAWVRSQAGSSLDYDGIWGAQCVDLIMYYYKFLEGYNVSGNAVDYISNDLPEGWYRDNTPSPGAIVVWGAGSYEGKPEHYADSQFGHIGIVDAVYDGYINYYDQNSYAYGQTVGLHEGHEAQYAATYIHPNLKGGFINYGDDFYATICTRNSSVVVGQSDSDNAVLVSGTDPNETFIFHFTKVNSNNGYVIRSTVNDKVLEVDGAYDADGTNAQFYPYHNNPAQVWYFQSRGEWVSMTAGCTSRVLDVYYSNFTAGTNLSMYPWNGTNAQQFNIWKIGDTEKVGVNYGDDFYAVIKHAGSQKPIGYNDSNNIELMTESANNYDRTIWHFTRLNNSNAYRISNLAGNLFMDVDGANNYDGVNIQCYNYHDHPAQEWYIQNRAGYQALTAGCTTRYIYLKNESISDGTNVVLRYYDNNNAQKFTFDIIDEADLVDYNISTDKEKIGLDESVNISIGGALPYVYNYTFYITYPNGSSTYIDNGCNNVLNYTPPMHGTYNVYAIVKNPYHTDTGSVTNKYITFDADFNSFIYDDIEYVENEDGTLSIEKYHGTAKELVIPSTVNGKTVTSIERSPFYDCDTLVKVTFPDTITKYDATVFANCDNLKTVILPRGITKYEYGTFFLNCDGLTEVEFPDSVTELYGYLFWGCKNLSTLVIPSSVTKITRGGAGDMLYTLNDNQITIYGTPGSAAEEYASYKSNVTFVDIKERPEPVETVILGDADGDGQVSALDTTWVQRFLARQDVPETYDEAAADVDGDGEVTALDVTWLQRYLAKMDIPYTIGEAKS